MFPQLSAGFGDCQLPHSLMLKISARLHILLRTILVKVDHGGGDITTV